MRTVKVDNEIWLLANHWNELTRQGLLLIASAMGKPIDWIQLSLKLLIMELNWAVVRKKERSKLEGEFLIDTGRGKKWIGSSDLAFIATSLKFILDPKGKKIYSKLYRNLIPEFQLGASTWIGPADALTNLIFEEYIHTETHYTRFAKTADPHHLHLLIATLYRPPGLKLNPGDRRKAFDDFSLEEDAKHIANWPQEILMAILLFYQGCKERLAFDFPRVFTDGSGSKDNTDTFTRMQSLTDALSNGDVTKQKEIRKCYLYEVLMRMEESLKQQERVEALTKKKPRV
jgi:hypothetical protein